MIIDGKAVAQALQHEIKINLQHIKQSKPGLAFILVGQHPPSHAYVKMKKKACAEVGIHSEVYELKENVSQSALLHIIHECNKNPSLHGILVQQPLPPHLQTEAIIEAVDPSKDVDGFHPFNIGKTLLGHEDGFLPCTPFGIVTLLQKTNISVEGRHVVILGRSNIVGKPLAAMLIQKKPHCNATVTIAHSQTPHLKNLCTTADILICAIGKPKFVTADMIKPQAVVIDVGINPILSGDKKSLVGDVDFKHVAPLCSYITPVPGGVGPMTIAMLLHNTYLSFLKKLKA